LARQIVHIGQRKTGSTWLQEIFHIAHAAGEMAYERDDLWRWHRKHDWKTATDDDYDELSEICARYVGKTAVLSLEGLSMRPPERILNAVAKGLPEAKILMATRNPLGYLVSSFSNSIISGGTKDVDAFADKFAGHLKRSHNLIGWEAAADAAFGGGQIRFVPYEMLADKPRAYLAKISAFVGVDFEPYRIETNRNATPPGAVLELMRRVNAALEEEPHRLSRMREWNAMKYVLTNATGYATELHGFFERYLEHFDMSFKLDALPPKLQKVTRPLMEPIRTLPLYKPYLGRYGLDKVETIAATAAE
jgi:hypothetical protein